MFLSITCYISIYLFFYLFTKIYVDKNEQQRTNSRQSLERYLFYYNRYRTHEQSLQLEMKVQDKTRYVDACRKVLLEHCIEGYDKNFENSQLPHFDKAV
ncbi:Protein CBG24533 [Caenorhabditis briggsae]|uniref:Protein CBG24533 n=1 Tax=Caenorhabditis briggsae TaxID=6238 RepID=A8WKX4_CAEBR|nr:Protein CBG24533 [Caenorhabditis briggsae]CAP21119.2 Protein CBG24533 [Caenorhabditis briggsae]